MRLQGPGIAPADAGLPWRDPDVPGKTSPTLAAHRLLGRVMEVLAGFQTHTDHQAGAADRAPATAWRAGQHADHGHLRQRR